MMPPATEFRPTGPRFHYAWVVVAVTFLTLIVAAGVRSVPGVLIVPLEHEFGWTRATISFAVSINLLLYGLIGPFAAGFINLYGPRRIMLLAFVLVAAGGASTALVMKHSWQLTLLWGVLVGSGTGLTALVLGATVPPTVALTARVFGREKLGIMFGWIIASHQVGAALAAWGTGLIRTNEGAYDHAFLISGSLCVLTAAGVLLIGRGPGTVHATDILQGGAVAAPAPN